MRHVAIDFAGDDDDDTCRRTTIMKKRRCLTLPDFEGASVELFKKAVAANLVCWLDRDWVKACDGAGSRRQTAASGAQSHSPSVRTA